VYRAYGRWTTAKLVDAWIWDFCENTSVGNSNWGGGQVHRTGDFKAAIDAWNAAHGGTVELGVYEYGPGLPWPVYTATPAAAMDSATTTLILPNATAYNPHDDARDDCAKICPGTWLHLGDEWMTVASRVGAACVVNRAQGGTTAAPHGFGPDTGTLLVAPIAAGDPTCRVQNRLVAFVGQYLNVDSEWVLVTGITANVPDDNGGTLAISRAQLGSTAAGHFGAPPFSTPPGAILRSRSYLQNDWLEGVRDLTLHPNFRIAHRDALERFQALGVKRLIPSSLDQEWSGGTAWSDYHAIAQRPGRGDGTGGGLDNRLCLARRGQAHSKAATVNQDLNTDSVRGQAQIDFLRQGGGHRRPAALPRGRMR
jgi:hypothetical protein